MKFKSALIECRWSREDGRDYRGQYVQGITYSSGYIQILISGERVELNSSSGAEGAYMEIKTHVPDGEIDAEIFINDRYVYSFSINGVVTTEYNTVRFYLDGFWYLLEYRFRERENS